MPPWNKLPLFYLLFIILSSKFESVTAVAPRLTELPPVTQTITGHPVCL